MSHRLIGAALCVLLSCGAALAGGPAVQFREVIELWSGAVLHVQGPAEQREYVDCYAGLEQRVPPRWHRLLRALEPISGLVKSETLPEMLASTDTASYVAAVRAKTDWSPAVRAMVLDAVRQAGFVPAGGFLTGGVEITVWPTNATADTGRCDGVECNPYKEICDCKKPVLDAEGFPVRCDPPRVNCNTSVPVKFVDPPGPLVLANTTGSQEDR